jgi:hypothetical protein
VPEALDPVAAITGALRATVADLEGYIERRAAEHAAPIVAVAERGAKEAFATARAEVERKEDLITELGRRLRALERQAAHWREVAEGRAGDFILRFDEVRAGDRLAADRDSELVTVLGVDTYDDHLGVSVQHDGGRRFYLDVQPDSLTAVRREVKSGSKGEEP